MLSALFLLFVFFINFSFFCSCLYLFQVQKNNNEIREEGWKGGVKKIIK